MSIIEKLGISPDYDFSDIDINAYPHMVFNVESIIKLKNQRDEMLEALIEVCYDRHEYNYFQLEAVKVIEKATGKSWEEIKERINAI